MEHGFYVECYECSEFTPCDPIDVRPSRVTRLPICANCEDNGEEDCTIVHLVQVGPCDGGDDCHSDDHHYGLGLHVTDIELYD